MNKTSAWRSYLPSIPMLGWASTYKRETFASDAIAALIVTIMLIPQSLAYALLAGLPPEVGLYASVAPLLLYAVFGTSRVLAVGPVAVASLMTAAAIGEHALAGSQAYWAVAITLAFMSGCMLMVMGILTRSSPTGHAHFPFSTAKVRLCLTVVTTLNVSLPAKAYLPVAVFSMIHEVITRAPSQKA